MNCIRVAFYGFVCVVLIACRSEDIFTNNSLPEQPPIDVKPVLLNIEINPEPFSIVQNPETQDYLLGVGYKVNLMATGYYDDGSEQDITQQVEWSVSDSSVARMESNALVSEQKGRVTIQANLGPYVSNTLEVLINPVGLQYFGGSSFSSGSGYIQPKNYSSVGFKDIVVNDMAFAALKLDGTVITFGSIYHGAFEDIDESECFPGCSTISSYKLKQDLTNVDKVFASEHMGYKGGVSESTNFVALKTDGSTVWWGGFDILNPDFGDSSNTGDYESLPKVQDMVTYHDAYYTLNIDGTMSAFGYYAKFSDFYNQKPHLFDIKKIFINDKINTVVALNNDNTLISANQIQENSYGLAVNGLSNVIDVKPILYGFFVFFGDGTAAYIGGGFYGIGGLYHKNFENVKAIYDSQIAAVVLTTDNNILDMLTGDVIFSSDENNPIIDIVATSGGKLFAALMKNGEVYSWEATPPEGTDILYPSPPGSGKNIFYHDVVSELVDVVKLHATYLAIVAVKKDGSVVTWGDAMGGGDSSRVKDELVNVIDVKSTRDTYENNLVVALREDGTLVAWGNPALGVLPIEGINNVAHIFSNAYNFAAIQVFED